jgi:aminomethyltransferase
VLHDRHTALGAAFTDFGGWLMPVRYGSDLAEHRAVREAAGLFDISHMAEFLVSGPGAGGFLDYALSARIASLGVGRARYSLVLEDTGGIVDDVIVYRLAAERFLVIANAGNRDAVSAALDAAGRAVRASGADAGAAQVRDVTDDYGLLAVQGPRAAEILAAVPGITGLAALEALPYYGITEAVFGAAPLLLARTGYTGEDGFELLVPTERAPDLWDALLTAGAPRGLTPAGLAARDTLRLEAGMPLYGHELGRSIRPAQAGLRRAVGSDKADFVGRAALAAADDGAAPVLVGLVSEGKRAGRAGYAVYRGDQPVGEVTSGALSPTLEHPIALAFVDPGASAPGTSLTLDVRGTRVPATVTALPFYRRKK